MLLTHIFLTLFLSQQVSREPNNIESVLSKSREVCILWNRMVQLSQLQDSSKEDNTWTMWGSIVQSITCRLFRMNRHSKGYNGPTMQYWAKVVESYTTSLICCHIVDIYIYIYIYGIGFTMQARHVSWDLSLSLA